MKTRERAIGVGWVGTSERSARWSTWRLMERGWGARHGNISSARATCMRAQRREIPPRRMPPGVPRGAATRPHECGSPIACLEATPSLSQQREAPSWHAATSSVRRASISGIHLTMYPQVQQYTMHALCADTCCANLSVLRSSSRQSGCQRKHHHHHHHQQQQRRRRPTAIRRAPGSARAGG